MEITEVSEMKQEVKKMDDSGVVFDASMKKSVEDFDKSMKEKFPDEVYQKLKIVGAFLLQGITLEESCILARIDPERFTMIFNENADVRAYITFKQTSWKAKLLRTLTNSAIDRMDEKVAGWLLQRKFKKEYGDKAEGIEIIGPHVLEQGLDFIRKNGDTTPLIRSQQ